jgi:aldose 1-epimerase
MRRDHFGKMPSGEEVHLFTLSNKNDVEAKIITYGGIIVSLKVPDRRGQVGDTVLGYDALDGYLKDTFYFGGIIGRYANRIAKGKFSLNGVTHTLACNNGENHLHGGRRGFDKVLWKADRHEVDFDAIKMEYLSKDGDEGFPGNLRVRVVYSLTNNNELRIDYAATTDRDTVINLTNHSYFNLTGNGSEDILQHELLLNASHFTPVDAGLIPTGEIESVSGTPFDFTRPSSIGSQVYSGDPQLNYCGGYDHNWVLNGGEKREQRFAAGVYEPESGRVLEIHTSEPGIQFYSGNFLDGSIRGKQNKVYSHRAGFCLEPQHFPDSPNQPDFPSTILRAGGQFHSTTTYKFSIRR